MPSSNTSCRSDESMCRDASLCGRYDARCATCLRISAAPGSVASCWIDKAASPANFLAAAWSGIILRAGFGCCTKKLLFNTEMNQDTTLDYAYRKRSKTLTSTYRTVSIGKYVVRLVPRDEPLTGRLVIKWATIDACSLLNLLSSSWWHFPTPWVSQLYNFWGRESLDPKPRKHNIQLKIRTRCCM